MIKAIIYIITLILTIWALDGVDLNKIFKQSRIYQARIIYLFIAISLSYLVTNFLYDFCLNFQIVK